MAMRAKPMPTLAGIKAERARRNFYAFCQQMADFEWEDNWHLRKIAGKLQEVVDGSCRRLILTIPFRHGKSQLGSRFFPPYFLGHHPDRKVIGTSHSSSLATDMSRDAKRVVMSEDYRRVFPDVGLNAKNVATDSQYAYKNTADTWEIVGHRGGYHARGAGQAIQGKGADLIVIDDVFGSREDAYSERSRERIKDWYDNDVKSRLSKDGAIVVINTRMHHDDLIGYLLDMQDAHEEADQWEVINFPAVKENDDNPDDPREIGEALWPWRMDVDQLEALKATRPDIYWGSYQGHPTPPGGTIVKTDDIRHWERLPGLEGRWAQSWDLRAGGKSKKSSFAVGQLWFSPKSEPANAYLIDQKRGRWDINETLDRMLECSDDRLWSRATEKLVENAADGRAVIPMLQNKVPGIVPVSAAAKGDKEGALQAVAPFFRSGNVFVPPEKAAPWVKDFVHEMTTFPGSANDDQVDACSQALAHLLIPDADDDVLKNWRHW